MPGDNRELTSGKINLRNILKTSQGYKQSTRFGNKMKVNNCAMGVSFQTKEKETILGQAIPTTDVRLKL